MFVKITNLIKSYREPRKFWQLIKKIKSDQLPGKQYLTKDNRKLIEDKEKEETFREIWEKKSNNSRGKCTF